MSDVYISYTHSDRDFVNRLVEDLEQAGLTVFFDQKIPAGASWADSLTKAIESARFLLVVLSPAAVASEWIRQEIMVGLEQESKQKTTVIPVMLHECELPFFLRIKTWADFTKDYAAGLRALLRALKLAPLGSDERLPGSLAPDADPSQIAQLRTELKEVKEAVALFKREPNRAETTVKSDHIKSDQRRCFIVMPFGDENLQVVYEDFVRPVIEARCGLECERGDDVFGSSVIMDDIRNSINRADIVVADLTHKNANVFYEVGICHALDKPVLLMAQSIDDVPFDLRHRRILLYEYSPRGCKKLEKTLQENLLAMIGNMQSNN
jgi:hypothetical protein